MTVSASSSDCATTAIRQLRPSISVRKKETPWSAGRAIGRLSRRDAPLCPVETRIVSSLIHGLLHLHHVVGTSKPEGVDLKPSWLAVPALPIKRLRGDEETRSFQVDFRVWMRIIEGGRENPRLHGHDSSNEVVNARGAQGVSDLGFE